MSKIFNYDSSTIRIVRDDENINFYSKDLLIVYGIFPNVIFEYDGNVVEKLDYTNITSPDETTLNEYVTLFQTWIDQYIPPVPDPTIKLKAHTVGEPDIEIDIAIGTNLSITNNTLNATGGGGSSVTSVTDNGNGVVTVDNTNPLTPIIEFNGVNVDGVTVTGDGTAGNPLVSPGGILKGTASGTDTFTTTITGVTAYNDGDAYLIRFTNGNTTGCTLNINSLGAKNLYRNNDGLLIGGDIESGAEMFCIYNSIINGFQLIGTSPNILLSYVTNADSVTITKGQPVYAFSGQGDRLTVKLAYNTLDATSAQTVGLVLSTSIATNQKGLIIVSGLLDGLSILPTATWNDGDPVYLGATAGTITNVKPHAPNHLVYLGFVTTASNGSAGRLYVRVQNGYELDELHNVQAQTPTYKDTLWYDNTVSPAQWKTASIPTILGYTPVNKAGDTMTGSLILNANPSVAYGAATKDYVDTLINGIDWKTSVNAATTTALPSYTVGGSGQTLTGTGLLGLIDGISLTLNQRLLVKNETSTNTPNNGIYVLTQVSPFILTRTSDANTSTLLAEATVSVAGGSTLSNTQWHCNPASVPVIIGSTNITFAQIGSGVYTASSPLSITGNIISIQDAAADGTTKGAAAFTASDFNSTSGIISIDYTNGQSASSLNKGFLTSTDWNTFNGKQDALSSGVNIKTVQSTSIVGSGDVTITDANLSTSDITTNDVSTTKHGFAPKAPNDTTKFLRGDATWAVPNNNEGWSIIIKSANQDVTNNATLQDDTDFQFSVVAGGHYMVSMNLTTSANNSTGDLKWGFNVSAGTIKGYGSIQSIGTTSAVQNVIISANSINVTTAIPIGAESDIDFLVHSVISYSFTASANATFKFQFANNAAGAGRTSRTWKGSILKYKRLD